MLKWFVLCSAVTFLMCTAHVAFTNLKCNFIDKSYGDFQYCYIKAVNRTHKYINIYAKMVPQALNNISVNIQLLRKSNGYKPFFMPKTFDACKFLRKPSNPLLIAYYNTIKDHSNINHTCPYDHDIIVDKLYTGNQDLAFTRYLPIPHGDYAITHTLAIIKTIRQVKSPLGEMKRKLIAFAIGSGHKEVDMNVNADML
ncbi:uncharacterized protein Dmoj_GI12638 [Drosophila mojavensis]|uniref:Uncharacterized protein n=1 Tax=Drosophila mojavensis TaxID=7230 RepID=B4KW61_DROMO|nr:uncharacterized protein Dmoj_GI12638 [Drosophila mojavensis]